MNLELIVTLMFRVLFIEIIGFHTFAWAEDWMSDSDLVAGDGEAAQLVSYIRADESPHVGYLRTALSEMRDRTWIGDSGKPTTARDDRHLAANARRKSLGPAREEGRKATLREVEHWVPQRANGADILAEFHAAGDEKPR